ncbi:hypothetical protein F1735_03020 [Massilia sp. CCM 8694]|uniref:Uncharacterized protein n=1 Tax=Massilia genomosp. 1 TaxID=2609280 RepID=A0ABX0ML08_9BURK|nr:hypothetical protein [Massilia genomosp. 1]
MTTSIVLVKRRWSVDGPRAFRRSGSEEDVPGRRGYAPSRAWRRRQSIRRRVAARRPAREMPGRWPCPRSRRRSCCTWRRSPAWRYRPCRSGLRPCWRRHGWRAAQWPLRTGLTMPPRNPARESQAASATPAMFGSTSWTKSSTWKIGPRRADQAALAG